MNRQAEQYIPCPKNNEACFIKDTLDGCHEDEHHKVKQYFRRLVFEAFKRGEVDEEYLHLVRAYIRHPMNRVIACRWIHVTVLEPATPLELPSAETMSGELEAWNGA